jgi:hypothetical protein
MICNQRNLELADENNMSNFRKKLDRIIYDYTDYVNRIVWKKY